MLTVVSFIRSRINGIAFDVFMKSINTASDKQTNSLIIFIISCKQLREIQWEGLFLILQTYLKLINVVKKFIPDFGEMKALAKKKFALGLGEVPEPKTRSQFNRWMF